MAPGRALVLDMREFQYIASTSTLASSSIELELPPDLEVITDLAAIDRLRQEAKLHFLKLDTDRLIIDQPFPSRCC